MITYAEHECMYEAIIVWFKLLFQYLLGRVKKKPTKNLNHINEVLNWACSKHLLLYQPQ
jgi:hypothetical protein